jgi:hypothetical protein
MKFTKWNGFAKIASTAGGGLQRCAATSRTNRRSATADGKAMIPTNKRESRPAWSRQSFEFESSFLRQAAF